MDFVGICESLALDGFDEEALRKLRQFRNVCAGNNSLNDLAIKNNSFQHIVQFCHGLTINKTIKQENSDLPSKLTADIVLAILQLLANFVSSSSSTGSDYIVNTITFQRLEHIFCAAKLFGGKKGIGTFFHVLYVITHEESEASRNHLNKFIHSRSLLCQILLSIVDIMSVKQTDQVSENNDPVLQWSHILSFLWVKRGVIGDIFNTVGPSESTQIQENDKFFSFITHEQLLVLRLSVNVLEDPYCVEQFIELQHEQKQLFLRSLIAYLVTISEKFCQISFLFIDNITDPQNKIETDVLEQLKNNNLNMYLCWDFISIALETIGSILRFLSSLESSTCKIITNMSSTQDEIFNKVPNLLTCCISWLKDRHVNGLKYLKERKIKPKTEIKIVEQQREEELKEVLKDCLLVISNLIYKCFAAQESLRLIGGLATILSFCTTDFANPLAREWALLCVRNACEGNEENQLFIEQLKPQNVEVQDEKLKAQGLKVDYDAKTGKFSLKQEKPDSNK